MLRILSLAAALLIAGPAPLALAAYPDHPIRLVVGYAAGGGTDRLARLFAKALGEEAGVPVVVENRTGAVGTIAAHAVSRAEPDGYTLLFSAGSDVTLVKFTQPSLPYDVEHGFTPISRIAHTPYVLITNTRVPGRTVADLLGYARAQRQPPAIAAVASISRLSADLFSLRSDLQMQTVLYTGATTPVADMIADHIRISFDVLPSVLPQLQAHTVVARAVASAERSSLLPDVPTMIESGYPDFLSTVWYSVLAPPRTTPVIAGQLNEMLQRIVASDSLRRQLLDQGYEAFSGDTPETLRNFLRAETARWGEVIRVTGFTP